MAMLNETKTRGSREGATASIPTPPTESFLDLALARVRGLCAAVGFEVSDVTSATALLSEALFPWGGEPIGAAPRAPSDIGDDHFPLEFSLALDRDEAEVRILFEAQATVPSVAAQWECGLDLCARLARRQGVALDRLRAVEDLFVPTAPGARYGLWHAICLRPRRAPRFKIYMNPQAQGRARAPVVVGEAVRRLGFSRATHDLVTTERGAGELKFFSLDLDAGAEARVKVYRVHPDATRNDIEAELSLARYYRPEALAEFWKALAAAHGPFRDLPISTYLALTSDDDRPTAATVHFPVRAYADDDQVVHDRLRGFLRNAARENYERAIRAFARRPLVDGVGMHSYVSLGLTEGASRVTIYLSPEVYRVSAPRIGEA
jgi:DMATS type aromatic prenyltransferase